MSTPSSSLPSSSSTLSSPGDCKPATSFEPNFGLDQVYFNGELPSPFSTNSYYYVDPPRFSPSEDPPKHTNMRIADSEDMDTKTSEEGELFIATNDNQDDLLTEKLTAPAILTSTESDEKHNPCSRLARVVQNEIRKSGRARKRSWKIRESETENQDDLLTEKLTAPAILTSTEGDEKHKLKPPCPLLVRVVQNEIRKSGRARKRSWKIRESETENQDDLLTEKLTAPAILTSTEGGEKQKFEPPCPLLVRVVQNEIRKSGGAKKRSRKIRESETKNQENIDILNVDLDGFVNEKYVSLYMQKSFPSDDAISKIAQVGRMLQVKVSLPAIQIEKASSPIKPDGVGAVIKIEVKTEPPVLENPLIVQPKNEVFEEEPKFLRAKRILQRMALKLEIKKTQIQIKNKKDPATKVESDDGADSYEIPLTYQRFKIPKRKDPEKAKLVEFSPILKQSPREFVPNEEASCELRRDRKVRLSVPKEHREHPPKPKKIRISIRS